MIKLYQPYFNANEINRLSPLAIPWNAQNNIAPDTREYELFKMIAESNSHSDQEPWGLVSQKFSHKAQIPLEKFYDFATKQISAGFDCAFINPHIGQEAIQINVWEQGEQAGHHGLLVIAQHLEQSLGIPFLSPMSNNVFAFSNFFIAKPSFWDKYFSFVDQVLSNLEHEASLNTQIGHIYISSAKYLKDPSAKMRPFIIERLLSTFMQNSDFLISPYLFEKKYYLKKFGEKYGSFIFQLSALKNTGLKFNASNLVSAHNQIRHFLSENSAFMVTVAMLDEVPDFFLTQEYLDLMQQNF
ncbi:hypothetical protein G6674_00695 [Polynucleobacter paneuropaeus]|nr:hypothetical protein G6674_00695 [Polynucleobacter paneuropaeus]